MAGATSQPHVLCINNSQDVLALFQELMEEEGFRVTTQSYAFKDLAGVKEIAPDAIILDYMWAGEDSGWSMLQMLKMDRATAKIPLVLCTGAAREVAALSEHLIEMGIKVVLKPFDIDHMLKVLNGAIGRPAAG